MAETSYLWTTDGTGDGTDSGYTQANLNQIYRMMFVGTAADEGVLKGYLNALEVTNSTGRTMSTNTGAALVYGFPYYNSAAVTTDLTHPTVGTTGYRIVLRADWTAQTVRMTKIESADGTAAIPAMTQSANTTWDIPLAEGTITTGDVITVTDDRVYLHPNFEVETANIADSQVTAAKIANRTRLLWIPTQETNWNETDSLDVDRSHAFLYGNPLTDGKIVHAFGSFTVPSDYASGGVVVPVVYAAGTGNMYAGQSLYYAATGETPTEIATALAAQAMVNTKVTACTTIQTAFGAIAAGDFVSIKFKRDAVDATDTIGGYCQIVGWYLTYTADS